MKNKLERILTIICLAALIASSCLWTGCASNGNSGLLGTVKQVIVGDDYEAAGKVVGEAGYDAYVILKGNPKYDKYTKKCEEIYAALDAQDAELKIGTINTVAMEVMNAALTVKYGYAKAQLITTGVRIGGAVADRIIAKRVDAVAADQFLKGFKQGVDLAIARTPADALIPIEKEPKEKAFECPNGNCSIVVGTRNCKVQKAVAKQLIDEKYVDKDEKRVEELKHTPYENCKELIARIKNLRKFGVEETACYIHHFVIKEGKLAEIEFRMYSGEEYGETIIYCVECCMTPELDFLVLDASDAE